MSKELVYIRLQGCDDNTTFDMELSKEELEILRKVSERSKKVSRYRCMPTLSLIEGEEAKERQKEELEDLLDEWEYDL